MDQKPPKNNDDDLSAVKRNLITIFKTKGIVRLDRHRVLKKLPSQSPSPEMETVVQKSLTEFLREQRFINSHESQPPTKRTRLQIEPGKSISTVDSTVVEVEHTLNVPVISEPSTSYQTSQDDNNHNVTDCNSDTENIATNHAKNTLSGFTQIPTTEQFILAKFESQKGIFFLQFYS